MVRTKKIINNLLKDKIILIDLVLGLKYFKNNPQRTFTYLKRQKKRQRASTTEGCKFFIPIFLNRHDRLERSQ